MFGFISKEDKRELEQFKHALNADTFFQIGLTYHTHYMELVNSPKRAKKYLGDEGYYYILRAIIRSQEEDFKVMESITRLITYKPTQEYIIALHRSIDGRVSMEELRRIKFRTQYESALQINPVETHTKLTYAYNKFQAEDKYGADTPECDRALIELERDYNIETSSPAMEEEIKLEFTKKLLEHDLVYGNISKEEYQKSISTLEEKSWYRFNVIVDDEDPSVWDFDLDYNEFFVKTLINSGFVPPEEMVEDMEDDDVEHLIIEMWFKKTITGVAAGLLRDGESETFRSVVSEDPAAAIVEDVQIDISEYDGDPEEFQALVKGLKNRRSYR